MNEWPLGEAVTLAVRSDVMLIAAITIIGSTYLLGRIAENRALAPDLPWRQALAPHITPDDRSHAGAGTATTLVVVALLGLTGALTLTLTGHTPSPLLTLGTAGIAATIAVAIAVRICGRTGPRSILAVRGGRLIASSLFAEVSAALAVVITIAVVLHTEGLTAVSIVEVVAISLATRLAVRLSPWPGGLGIADAALLIPLTWIGVPVHVGISTLIIWRAGSLLAATAAVLLARGTLHAASHSEDPAVRDQGRLMHRTVFMAISLLPARIRDAVRRTVFDALFALSQDPWDYQTSAYECRKREHLLAAVPVSATRLVEIGCAEGHNLVALARMRPAMTLIGFDISATAAALACERTADLSNIRILGPGDATSLSTHGAEGIDCVVLSEVLYYMGPWQTMRRNLDPLREVMTPDCLVVMVHGASDASTLHRRAARALDLQVIDETLVSDPTRPFVITVARAQKAVEQSMRAAPAIGWS